MRKILITGGSGTVGQSFIREYLNHFKFAILSRNESLQHDTKQKFPDIECFLGSVENKETLYSAYDKFRPDVVVHAAALKHVDLAEKDPITTGKINVTGSINVIDASLCFNVPVTVAISTDKACNHQNTYGMSKYLMERCFMHANGQQNRFCATRFANVAHSNGSVIPLWLDMATRGAPLRITDPTMNRLMFSRQDAAQLIRKAIDIATNESGGFILTKRMKSVNIKNLALSISKNIEIVGARAGEKVNEDLVSENEIPYTILLDEDYIKIGSQVNTEEHRRIKMPLNSLTAENMSAMDIMNLVYANV